MSVGGGFHLTAVSAEADCRMMTSGATVFKRQTRGCSMGRKDGVSGCWKIFLIRKVICFKTDLLAWVICGVLHWLLLLVTSFVHDNVNIMRRAVAVANWMAQLI